jgi:tetratricopeptide (TPR) repeat protein
MKKIIPLIFVSIITIYAKAQDFVKYSGDNEKNLITSAKTADDFLKLSLASELSDGDAGILYGNFIQQIKILNLPSLVGDKSERHLKKIYDVVHTQFLRKYNPGANFGDFIVNGNYNDISASILYAYVLESLSIPYHITQYPAHIFIMAEHGTDNVKFETIDPTTGVYFISDESKQKIVLNAIKTGYIDQSYAIRIGAEKAFDEFIYGKEDIDLKETVATLYFNRAMNEVNAGLPAAAYSDLYKSNILYPDRKNEYFEDQTLLAMTENFKYNDIADWHALVRLDNNRSATDNLKNYTQGEFQNYMNDKLLNAGQKDKVAEVYNYLHSNLTDTALKKQIAKIYFVESSNYYIITSKYDDALDCLSVAYQLDPNNPIIVSNFGKVIRAKYERAPTAQNLSEFDAYVSQHPALKSNNVITSVYEYYYGTLGEISYLTGNVATGEKYLKMMTDLLDNHPDDSERNHQAVTGLFAKASIYYFRKQQKQKAIEVLKKGLKYEPDSDELQRKLTTDSSN